MPSGTGAFASREESPEEAAASILPALKYLASEAERAGLDNLANSIDYAIKVAAEAVLTDGAGSGAVGPCPASSKAL